MESTVSDDSTQMAQETNPEYFRYRIEDTTGSIVITGYSGPDANVVIPNVFENRPVLTIGSGAFEDNQVIKSVVIPNTVTTIEGQAFKNSTLEEIVLPDHLQIIEEEVFESCPLTEVDIPQGTTTIGIMAFYSCELSRVSLPNSLQIIAANAFYNNPSLSEVTIPESVTYIGNLEEEDLDNFLTLTVYPRSRADIRLYGYSSLMEDISNKVKPQSFPAFDDQTVFYGKSGSFAEKYVNATAEYYGYKFIAI